MFQQKGKAAIRAFQGLVGMPYDPESKVAPEQPVSVPQVPQERIIWEPKKPGPSRTYNYSNEAERKQVARIALRLQIEKLLNNFDIEPEEQIPEEIEKRCGLKQGTTYASLLKDKNNRDTVLKMILRDLKTEDRMLHGFPEDNLNNNPESSKILMRDAPSKRGLVVSLGGSAELAETYGAQTEASRQLSGPQGYGNVGAGDRRKAAVALSEGKLLEAENERVQTDDSGAELTFANKIRWPKGWFQEKYKRPYAEVANECVVQVSRLLSIEEQDCLGWDGLHSAKTIYYCCLCHERQGPWPTPYHFVVHHQNAVIRLFREAGVLFKKAFFAWES